MRLNRKEIIAEQPIKLVRDFLRAYREGRPDIESVVEYFKTKTNVATAIAAALVERGLIIKAAPEEWDRRQEVYTVTDLGVRFAAASLMKPIPRAKADQIISDLLDRVKDINERDDLHHFVGEVRAFGSYITDSADVADIDLAISIIPKPPPDGKKLTEWHRERARSSGRVLNSFIDELLYCEREVRQLVKGRNPYISLHPMSDLDDLKTESRILYKSLDRPRYIPPTARAGI